MIDFSGFLSALQSAQPALQGASSSGGGFLAGQPISTASVDPNSLLQGQSVAPAAQAATQTAQAAPTGAQSFLPGSASAPLGSDAGLSPGRPMLSPPAGSAQAHQDQMQQQMAQAAALRGPSDNAALAQGMQTLGAGAGKAVSRLITYLMS